MRKAIAPEPRRNALLAESHARTQRRSRAFSGRRHVTASFRVRSEPVELQ